MVVPTTMMYVGCPDDLLLALFSASGAAIWLVTSNAYQVGQTYLLNNPSRLSQSVKQKNKLRAKTWKTKRRSS